MTDLSNATPENLRKLANDRSSLAQAGHRTALRNAADEIERLHKKLGYLVHTDEDIKVQNAEIERLQAALDEIKLVAQQGDTHAWAWVLKRINSLEQLAGDRA